MCQWGRAGVRSPSAPPVPNRTAPARAMVTRGTSIGVPSCFTGVNLLPARSPLLGEVPSEPVGGQACDLFESAGFLEEMAGAGNDLEALLGRQSLEGLLVEVDDLGVVAADDQEGWRLHALERVCRQIRPAAPRHDGADELRALGSGDESGGGAGAGADQADSPGRE